MVSRRPVPLWTPFRRLLPLIRPHAVWFTLSILSSLIGILVTIFFADLIRKVTDAALDVEYHRFMRIVAQMVLATMGGIVIIYFNKYATTVYQVRTIRDLRNQFTSHIQKLPVAYIEQHHSGDLVSRVNADVSKVEAFLGQLPQHVYQPILFLSAFTYLFWLNWQLLLATAILIPIAAVVYDKVSRPVATNAKALQEHLGAANTLIQDLLGGIVTVKAYNLQPILTDKFHQVAHQIQQKALGIEKTNSYVTYIFLILHMSPQFILPLYGGYLIFQGELTVGGLLAALRLIWYIFMPIEKFLGLVKEMRETAPALSRLIELWDHPTEPLTGLTIQQRAKGAVLEIENVGFGYNGKPTVLKRLNFQLQQNETVALVGTSGSGKSTIIKIICGFHPPQEGVIKLFGEDIHAANIATVRQHLSLMSQESYLFPATVAENISYGRLAATQAEIIMAAKRANAHDFIMTLPQGYDTFIGEAGRQLSGGERQRIALARTILKDAPILLLDEPTSALDTEAEALVAEALRQFMQGRTVLIIAHRLSTIQQANRVLVLDQGQIVETGDHQTLLARSSLYRKLYLEQTAQANVKQQELGGEGNHEHTA